MEISYTKQHDHLTGKKTVLECMHHVRA